MIKKEKFKRRERHKGRETYAKEIIDEYDGCSWVGKK